MTDLKLQRAEKDYLVPRLQEYLSDELGCTAGGFDTEFLLDFVLEEMGPLIYNRALTDARALLLQRLDSLSESIYELEKPVGVPSGR